MSDIASTNLSFGKYLSSQIGNHLKLVGIVAGVLGVVILVNYVRDLRKELAGAEHANATLVQQFQQAGKSAVAGNTETDSTDVLAHATTALGPEVISMMASQDARISSLTTAIGMTNASIVALADQPAHFTTQQQGAATGALTGYPMEETRKDGPPLSSVSLFYDPTKRDPNQAFAGTEWHAYREEFQTTVGEWVRQKDGGYRTTVALNRTVSKIDPTDPSKLIQVGTEKIPITGATTVYTPKGMMQAADFTVPRWTLGLGLTNSKQTGYTAFGQIDYRVTNRFGLFVGTANSGLLGGLSIRLDAKKQ